MSWNLRGSEKGEFKQKLTTIWKAYCLQYAVVGATVLKQYYKAVPKIILFLEWNRASPHWETAAHVQVCGTFV